MAIARRTPLLLIVGLLIVLSSLLVRAPGTAQADVQNYIGYVSVVTPTTQPGPIQRINVGTDTTMQIVDRRASSIGEFHTTSTVCTADLGVYVTVGSILYGPNPAAPFHCQGSNLPAPTVFYSPISQTVTGTGTPTAPYTITTTVRLSATLTLTQVVSYVPGSEYVSEMNTLHNSSGGAIYAQIFNVGQPAPGSNPDGNGFHDVSTGAVGASDPIVATQASPRVTDCSGSPVSPYVYDVAFSPVSTWQYAMVDQANLVFQQVAASGAGGHLTNTYNPACIVPAIAVEWDVTVAAGSSLSVSKHIVFHSTYPSLLGGTAYGSATCNSSTHASVSCISSLPVPCGSCGASYNFLLPVSCSSAQFDTVDFLNRTCSGSFVGHVGLPGFTMAVKSGGIQTLAPNVNQLQAGGTGLWNNAGASFSLLATDDDVTGTDTVKLTIHGINGTFTTTWTCTAMPSCLEVTPAL